MIIIIMGVSGCGKTTIGKLLSEKIGLAFYDADDFHPKSNIEKMSRGIPLQDEDRFPWLLHLVNQIKDWESTGGAILACSALKESYRKILMSASENIVWVHLVGSFELIKDRMEVRSNHFMLSTLLQTQFDALEQAPYASEIDISLSPEKIIESIVLKLGNHE